MADNRYQRVYYHGKLMDRYTMEAVKASERKLGYSLTIIQGSYNRGGVSASAGTHDGGGVIDFAPYDHKRKVRVLRSIGFAAWYRPAIAGLWSSHIHAVLIGNAKLSPAAQQQVVAYKNRRDGLASNGADTGPWLGVNVFKYPSLIKRLGKSRGPHVDRAIKAARKAKRNTDNPVRLRRLKRALSWLNRLK